MTIANDEAVEYEPSMLISLAQDVSRLDHYWLDYILHLSTDEARIYQEFECSLGFLAERFLPETYPQLKR